SQTNHRVPPGSGGNHGLLAHVGRTGRTWSPCPRRLPMQMHVNLTPYNDALAIVNDPTKGETLLTLAQGTGLRRIASILRLGSAGGANPDPTCGKPPDDVVKLQVMGNHGGSVGNPVHDVVEYSAEYSVANGFGRRTGCAVVVVRIKAKYLRPG